MAIICAYVWGRLILLVTIAMRKERFRSNPRVVPREP